MDDAYRQWVLIQDKEISVVFVLDDFSKRKLLGVVQIAEILDFMSVFSE